MSYYCKTLFFPARIHFSPLAAYKKLCGIQFSRLMLFFDYDFTTWQVSRIHTSPRNKNVLQYLVLIESETDYLKVYIFSFEFLCTTEKQLIFQTEPYAMGMSRPKCSCMSHMSCTSVCHVLSSNGWYCPRLPKQPYSQHWTILKKSSRKRTMHLFFLKWCC